MPGEERYRCGACGNLTRFDVVETRRTTSFYHFSLGGELEISEERVLGREVERVVCRWCGRSDGIEVLPRAGGLAGVAPEAGAAG